jgi:hypothetical protein
VPNSAVATAFTQVGDEARVPSQKIAGGQCLLNSEPGISHCLDRTFERSIRRNTAFTCGVAIFADSA